MYSTTMSMIDTVKHNMPCQPQIFLTDRRHINDSGRVRSLHRYRPGPCPALRRGPPSLLSPFSLCLSLSLSVFPSRRTMDGHEPAPPSASARARKPRSYLFLSLSPFLNALFHFLYSRARTAIPPLSSPPFFKAPSPSLYRTSFRPFVRF